MLEEQNMQVRHIEKSDEVVEIAQPKHEEQPPLEEIVQCLALLAAIHQGPPLVQPASPSKKKSEEEEEPDR
jgi:hypothetical protein